MSSPPASLEFLSLRSKTARVLRQKAENRAPAARSSAPLGPRCFLSSKQLTLETNPKQGTFERSVMVHHSSFETTALEMPAGVRSIQRDSSRWSIYPHLRTGDVTLFSTTDEICSNV